MSLPLQTHACQAPQRMKAPTRVSSTTSTFTLQWVQPEDNGGCPVLGYAIYRDDGARGSINVEINTVGDTNVRQKPSLRQVTVNNFPSGSTGLTYAYQVKVFNVVGSSLSETASFALASIPPSPQTAPTDDILVTSNTAIKVNLA